MAKIGISLIFNGNCKQAFELYRSVFGTDFINIETYGDIPTEYVKEIREEDKNKILDVCLYISEEVILSGKDTQDKYNEINNFSISLCADSKEEAFKLYEGLSEGGQMIFPMTDEQSWGGFTDRFGVIWSINYP